MKKSLWIAAVTLLIGGSAMATDYQNEKHYGPRLVGHPTAEVQRMVLMADGGSSTIAGGSTTLIVLSAIQDANGNWALDTTCSVVLSNTSFTVSFGGTFPTFILGSVAQGTSEWIADTGNAHSTSQYSMSVSVANGGTVTWPSGAINRRITMKPTATTTEYLTSNDSTITKAFSGDGGLISNVVAYWHPAGDGSAITTYLAVNDNVAKTVFVEFDFNKAKAAQQ